MRGCRDRSGIVAVQALTAVPFTGRHGVRFLGGEGFFMERSTSLLPRRRRQVRLPARRGRRPFRLTVEWLESRQVLAPLVAAIDDAVAVDDLSELITITEKDRRMLSLAYAANEILVGSER
jgi:hypothetical protein